MVRNNIFIFVLIKKRKRITTKSDMFTLRDTKFQSVTLLKLSLSLEPLENNSQLKLENVSKFLSYHIKYIYH